MTDQKPFSLSSIPVKDKEVIKVFSAPATIIYTKSLVDVLNELCFNAKYSLTK